MTEFHKSTEARLSAKNIGGIDDATVHLIPGISTFAGQNATNKTSMLQALAATIGSERVSLKSNTSEGEAVLSLKTPDGETEFSRKLSKKQTGGVSFSGDPFLSNTEKFDLFGFLTSDNDARRAVERGGDLRDILMRPVDEEQIDKQIQELQSKRDDIDAELTNLEDEKTKLPALEEERTTLKSELAEIEARLERKRHELEEAEKAVNKASDGALNSERNEALETTLSQIDEQRAQLEYLENKLKTEKQKREATIEEIDSLENKLREIDSIDDDELATLRTRKSKLQDQVDTLGTDIRNIRRRIKKNRTLISDGVSEYITEKDGTSVTDKLVEGERISCPTCGSEVTASDIKQRTQELTELLEYKEEDKRELENEIEEITNEITDFEDQKERETYLKTRLDKQQERLQDINVNIEQLEEEIPDVEDEVVDLENEVDDLREQMEAESIDENKSKIQERYLELRVDVSDLERQRESLEEEIADVGGRIDSVELNIDRISELEEQREKVSQELTRLRETVKETEKQAVEVFNRHMDSLIEILEYENIERVRLERTTQSNRESNQSTKAEFRLYVSRNGPQGVYEEEFKNLSESERELISIVFAFAGYLAHDVESDCPIILVDSLEAIDATRIARLIEYIEDHVEYLIAALLEDDAEVLADEDVNTVDISQIAAT